MKIAEFVKLKYRTPSFVPPRETPSPRSLSPPQLLSDSISDHFSLEESVEEPELAFSGFTKTTSFIDKNKA